MAKVYSYPKDCVPHEERCQHTNFSGGLRPWLCYQCSADDAFRLYARANNAYRNGEPWITDDYRFDCFEKYLRRRHPADRRFWKVGVIDESVTRQFTTTIAGQLIRIGAAVNG